MDTKKKFSLSYRIDSLNPAHVHFSVFSNMILDEYAHTDVSRAKCGDLCMRIDEFKEFLLRSTPHLLFMGKDVSSDQVVDYFNIILEDYNHVGCTDN